MNPDGFAGVNPRTNHEIEHYNSIAVKTMKKLEISVNDLYSVMKDKSASDYIDYAHFTEKNYMVLGNVVSTIIKEKLISS